MMDRSLLLSYHIEVNNLIPLPLSQPLPTQTPASHNFIKSIKKLNLTPYVLYIITP